MHALDARAALQDDDEEQNDQEAVQPELSLGSVEEGARLGPATHRVEALPCATEGGAGYPLSARAGAKGDSIALVGAERDDRATEHDAVTATRTKVLRRRGRLGRLEQHGAWVACGGWYPAREPSRRVSQPPQELRPEALIIGSPWDALWRTPDFHNEPTGDPRSAGVDLLVGSDARVGSKDQKDLGPLVLNLMHVQSRSVRHLQGSRVGARGDSVVSLSGLVSRRRSFSNDRSVPVIRWQGALGDRFLLQGSDVTGPIVGPTNAQGAVTEALATRLR